MSGRHRRKSRWGIVVVAAAGLGLIAAAGTALAVAAPHRHVTVSAAVPATLPRVAAPPVKTAEPAPAVQVYTIRPGDTLWGIARSRCGTGTDDTALQAANHLSSVLPAGKVIRIAC